MVTNPVTIQMGNCCGIRTKMHRNREVRENTENSNSLFDHLGGFGFGRGMFPSMFGGKDPFDDPFFTHPFGSMFESNAYRSNTLSDVKKPKGPVIKELDSDDEEDLDEDDDANHISWANKNPLVEHPEDQAGEHDKNEGNTRKEITYMNNRNEAGGNKSNSRNISFQRVTYGGVDGAYYTATTNRRTGNDGASVEEHKQADRTTGQASYRISRGIHDKGHSVTRKLGSDGKVDTLQTLHNLNEDELADFERSWRGTTEGHFHGWADEAGFMGDSGITTNVPGSMTTWGGFSDPFGRQRPNDHIQAHSASRGTPKKVVRINIE